MVVNSAISIIHIINNDFFLSENTVYNFLAGKIPIEIHIQRKGNIMMPHSQEQYMIKVIVFNIVKKKYTYSIDEMPITIGRTATTIVITDFLISKQYLIINFSKEQNVFYISDLKRFR